MPNDFSRRLKYSTLQGWQARCNDCNYLTDWVDSIEEVNLRWETHYCDRDFNKRSQEK